MAQLKDTIVLGDLRVTDALSADEITANKVTSDELELDLLNATLIKVALSSSGADHTKGITFGNNMAHVVANASGALILEGNGLYLRGQNNETTGVTINLNSAMFPETSTATTSSLHLGTASNRWNTVYGLNGNFNGTVVVKDTIYVNAQNSTTSGGISLWSSSITSLTAPTSYGIAMRAGAGHGWIMGVQTNANIARALNISTSDATGTDWNINFYNDGSKLRGFKFMRSGTAVASLNGYGYFQANRLGIYHDGTHSSRLYWYRPTYYTWVDYMTSRADGDAPTGGKPSTLGNVSTWSMHYLLENASNYGWIWESCSNAVQSDTTVTPTARMALSSNDGRLYVQSSGAANTSTINAYDTAGIASGAYKWGFNHTVANLNSGGNTVLLTGKSNADNQQAGFGYHHDDTANNRYAFIELYGNHNLLKVYKTGLTEVKTLKISSTSPEQHLIFNRSGSWNYITFPAAEGTYLAFGLNTQVGDNAYQQLVLGADNIVRPGGNNTESLGRTNTRWKDIYVAAGVYVGAANTDTSYNANATTTHISPYVIGLNLTATTLPSTGGLYLNYQSTNQARLYVETIGTTSVGGVTTLILGNASNATTAKNSRGKLTLYGSTTAHTNIYANPTGNHAFYLPEYNGDMYAVCRSNASSVGGQSTQPVYVTADGLLAGMTSVDVAHGGTGATTAANARINLGLGDNKVYYGTCSTAGGTAAKIVKVIDNASITTGTIIVVHNTNINTYSTLASLTITIQKTSSTDNILASKPLKTSSNGGVNSLSVAGEWIQGINIIAYDGTNWLLINSNYNTDRLVTQAYGTSNNNYPVLFTATAGISNTTSRGSTTTILNNQLYANVYTGIMYTTGLTINYVGTGANSYIQFNNKGESGSDKVAKLKLNGNSFCLSNGATTGVYINLATDVLMGAAWNDYAEYRHTDEIESGRCVQENDNGIMTKTNKRLIPGASIISDTYGFAQGETATAKTPVAVAGRVLAYPYKNRNEYHAGMAVCTAPNGTVDIMTREEIIQYPDCIIGFVSEVPDYEEWGASAIKVDGRIWIKVK